MFQKLLTAISLAFLITTAACSGTPGTGVGSNAEGTVGTIANKPAPTLSWHLYPDVSALISDESITVAEPPAEPETPPEENSDLSAAEFMTIKHLWNKILLGGSLIEARIGRNKTEAFFRNFEDRMNESGISDITAEAKILDLQDVDLFLGADTRITSVEMHLDRSDSDYFRFYFVDNRNQYVATYMVKRDDTGMPVIGLFAFVDPTLLIPLQKEGIPLVVLAYDFTDNKNYSLFTSDIIFAPRLSDYRIFQLYHRYDSVSSRGSILHAQIKSQSPARELSTYVRADWNTASREICLAPVENGADGMFAEDTYSFIGPAITSADEISKNGCELAESLWAPLTSPKLPYRFSDTNPEGGTPFKWYSDGTTKEGWNSLAPSLIESLLSATFLF